MNDIYFVRSLTPEVYENGRMEEYLEMVEDERQPSLLGSVKGEITAKTIQRQLTGVDLVISTRHERARALARILSKKVYTGDKTTWTSNGFIEAHLFAGTLIPDDVFEPKNQLLEKDKNVLVMINQSDALISLLVHSITKFQNNTNVLITAPTKTIQLFVDRFTGMDIDVSDYREFRLTLDPNNVSGFELERLAKNQLVPTQ